MTQEKLKEFVEYNQNTGVFIWKKVNKYTKYNKGKELGGIDESTGYKVAFVDGKKYRQHRLAWLYVYGEMPKGEIDHINQDRADNRICNLREVTHKENMKNKKISKKNTSGVTGVYFLKTTKKWYSQIRIDGDLKHLGYFKIKEDAIKARKDAEEKYGFHKNHGQGGVEL